MNKKKKVFILLGIIIIGCMLCFVCINIIHVLPINTFVKEKKNSNTVHKRLANVNVENFTFSKIECIHSGSVSTVSYVITNTSKKSAHLGEYILIFKSKDGEILGQITLNYDIDLKSKEEFSTSNSINADLSKVTSVDIDFSSEE